VNRAEHLVLIIAGSLLWTLVCVALARNRHWTSHTCRLFAQVPLLTAGDAEYPLIRT
jgi:hypothetical protein